MKNNEILKKLFIQQVENLKKWESFIEASKDLNNIDDDKFWEDYQLVLNEVNKISEQIGQHFKSK